MSAASRHPPHPENAPGDFYVEEDCCLRCEIPFAAAPDLFGVDRADTQCIVKRQPMTADELERMYRAIEQTEMDCIRYKGGDRAILIRVHQAATWNHGSAEPKTSPAKTEAWWRRVRRLGF